MKGSTKPRPKRKRDVVEQATHNLLKALTRDMLRKEGRVDVESSARMATANDYCPGWTMFDLTRSFGDAGVLCRRLEVACRRF